MSNKCLAFFISLFFLLPSISQANWLKDIFDAVGQVYGINLQTNQLSQSQLEQLTKINRGLTGTHHYGNDGYDTNRFNFGDRSHDWQSMLALTRQGGSNSALGSHIRNLHASYPIRASLNSKSETTNQYYLLHAQTTIAARANAELTFKELDDQRETMQVLHKKIDTTQDNKSAVDLNNRIMLENTRVGIQQTKLLAILVEQSAVEAQEKANRAKDVAEFFNGK